MAVDRVGIEIDVLGYDEAMEQMERLDSSMKGLSGRKNYLKVKAEVEQLKLNRTALRENKVKLKGDIVDVEKKIKRVKAQIEALGKRKIRLKADPNEVNKIDTRIKKLEAELRQLNGQKINLDRQFAQTTAEINQSTAAINRFQSALRNAGMAGKNLKQIFNSISSSVSHAGMAMQSMGNAMTRLTSPFKSIMRGTLYAGGFALFNMASQGLSSATSRYDTMKTYVPIMQALGHSTGDAETAINKLNEAVIGIPTGLDEIVEQHKLLTMAIGDVNKATDLAIASNNAWVASGADESRVTMAKKELQTLAQTGKLNERQWMTMQKGMSVSWGQIEEKMQKTGKIQGSLLEALKDGTVSAQEFMDALTWEGLHGKTKAVRDEIAHTYAAVTSNIQNAFSRLGYNVLATLDEVLKAATGKDTIDTLIGVSKGIDKLSEGIQNWIKANPDVLLNFLDAIKSFDWAGLGQGLADGAKFMMQAVTMLMKIPGARLLGWLMTFGSLFGSSLTVLGGMMKGSRHIIAGLGTMTVGLGRIMGGVGLGAAGGKIAKFGKWLKELVTIKGATDAAEDAVKAASKKTVNIKGSLARIGRNLAGVGSVLAIIAGTAGTIMISTKAIKSAIKDMGEISQLVGDVDWNIMSKVAVGFMSLVTAFTAIGTAAGADLPGSLMIAGGTAIVEGIVAMTSGFLKLTTMGIKGAVNDMIEITSGIGEIVDNVNELSGKKLKRGSVKGLANRMFGIYKNLIGGKGGKKNLADIDKSKVADAAEAMESFKGVFASLESIQESIKALKGFKGLDEKTETAIRTFATSLGSIYDSMDEAGLGDVGTKNAKTFDSVIQTASSIFTTMQSITETLPKLYESMQTALGSFDAQGRGATPFTGFVQQTKTLFTGFNEIFTSLNEDLLGNGQFDTKGIGRFSDTIGYVQTMFGSLQSIVNTLPKLTEAMTKAGVQGAETQGRGANPFTSLVTQIKTMFKGIGEIYQAINSNVAGFDVKGIDKQLSTLVTSIGSIRTIGNRLNKMGGKGGAFASTDTGAFTAIQNIKAMIKKLGDALNTDTISQLQTDVETFKTAVTELFDTLNSDLSNVEVEVKINGKVTGDKALILAIKAANSAIRSAVNSIQTSYSKTVTVHITPQISKGAMPSVSYPHTGGYIGGNGRLLYRAKGGGTGFFCPKGTDTVPAMLTPGEYVQSRSAVKFFGVEFMRRINNLDIAGAMRELSARAAMRQTASRGTVINNNITNNNNPTINQNINTNNPNFAFKRSNRYVMAL